MKQRSPTLKPLPLKMTCSTVFGRYPKISVEQVYNMFSTDNWMVNYSGYKKVDTIEEIGKGRGIFNSSRFDHLILVIDNNVYIVDAYLSVTRVGGLDTFTGDVFIAENDANQIAICDKKDIYIYNYVAETFNKVPASVLGFTPGYIEFQDGYFIAPDINNPTWRLSAPNNGLSWPAGSGNVGRFQTKPDNPMACVRFPGRGNLLFVIGKTVTEVWQDVGYQLFPYQRSSSINIDYGCLSASTIAAGDTFLIWLAVNEKSGPVIMMSSGGDAQPISNDGINYKLAQLKAPENSYGFLFKQDGKLFYQLTFPDPRDNLTLTYDLNDKKFYLLCDENMNYHIARKMAYFHNSYYFISFVDGNLYESNSKYTTYDGKEIPRIIIGESVKAADSSPFVVNNISFVIEQGMENEESLFTVPNLYKGVINTAADFPVAGTAEAGWYYKVNALSVVDNDPTKTNTGQSFVPCEIVWSGTLWQVIQDLKPRVDLSVSRDGGVSFSNSVGMQLNPVSKRQNRFVYWNLGFANEFVPQFRFWGTSRFVVSDGLVGLYQ
jgi:hypothetical protein